VPDFSEITKTERTEVLQESQHRTLRQFSRKQHLIVTAQTQQTHVQRLSPENKEVSPYIPLEAGYRSKRQGLIHIWLYSIL
jgi:hypothetical protein